ncbi:hypothetical protein F8388_006879, partial [Cannabis sativa]
RRSKETRGLLDLGKGVLQMGLGNRGLLNKIDDIASRNGVSKDKSRNKGPTPALMGHSNVLDDLLHGTLIAHAMDFSFVQCVMLYLSFYTFFELNLLTEKKGQEPLILQSRKKSKLEVGPGEVGPGFLSATEIRRSPKPQPNPVPSPWTSSAPPPISQPSDSPISILPSHPYADITSLSTLPFPAQNAKYHRELEAAVGVVERACRLCLDVKSSLFSSDGRVVEKNDQTPVTIADFGVQALVSLELGNLFPSIPLVAEEDSTFIRSNNLEDLVVNAVTGNSSFTESTCTEADVLQAIDRGGKDAFTFGTKPATYWVLDPIDGTRGFLKGSEALYVVGLALVVDGEIALGVMGCPNWQNEQSNKLGIIMVSHVGCGTWTKQSPFVLDGTTGVPSSWIRCFVDHCCIVHEARFCSQDSQSWDSLPLSPLFSATTDVDSVGENQVLLIPSCCGSLCKYLMVASGRASIFILRSKVDRIIKAWDHAVGMICVHEAGGKVSDWKGNQIDLAADEGGRRFIYPSGGVLD